MPGKKLKTIFLLLFSLVLPTVALSKTESKQLCFNFYIITKSTDKYSELDVYEKQKKIIFNQLAQTQLVLEKNKERNCPQVDFKKGITKRIDWQSALLLSQSLGFDGTDSLENYYSIKVQETLKSLKKITEVIRKQKNLKYYAFLEYQPIRKIVYAEQAIEKLNSLNVDIKHNGFEALLKSETQTIMQKMEEFETNSMELLIKDRERVEQYDTIDNASADSWKTGEMIIWNDLEAQNTSIEMKNLLNRYRTPENQCLDVYVIPSAKTPSRSIKEAEGNGRLTDRGGAALSSALFPRTTANKGHAIILTYNTRPSETKLAHELGHLLLDKKNAHKGKKEKDLMFGHSRGGSYLSEAECHEISLNLKDFHGGTAKTD